MVKLPNTATLVSHVSNAANTSRRHVWQTVRPDQAFSWQTLLFLCLFSWLMALLASDTTAVESSSSLGTWGKISLQTSPMKYALFTMGWIFLALAMGWLLSGSKLKVPLFDIILRPAAWAAAAIVCAFLFQIWHGDTLRPALTLWPVLAAAFYIFPRCVSLKTGYKKPKATERQHLLIIVLISLLVSCWIQFYFRGQDWVEGYRGAFEPLLPGIEQNQSSGPDAGADAGAGVNPQEPVNSKVADIAESIVANRLEVLPVPEIRRVLQTNPFIIDELNAQFDQALLRAGNSSDWALQIEQFSPSPLSFQLNVLPPFTADSPDSPSTANQSISKICQVTALENPSGDQLSRLECGDAIQSGT